jgi:hypothetical protein
MRPSETYVVADFPPGLVLIPALEWMWTETVNAILQLQPSLPPGSSIALTRHLATPAAARNAGIPTFLREPRYEWILFLDADMAPDQATVIRLLSHNVEAVGALCFQKGTPFDACFGALPGGPDHPDERGICPVAYVGTGCLLVRRKTMEALTSPWFEHPVPGHGEDVLFCEKIRALGTSVYLDTVCCVGHMSAQPINKATAFFYRQFPSNAAQNGIRYTLSGDQA